MTIINLSRVSSKTVYSVDSLYVHLAFVYETCTILCGLSVTPEMSCVLGSHLHYRLAHNRKNINIADHWLYYVAI